MIEKWIKNKETLKRWRKFKSYKKSVVACYCLLFCIFISTTAEVWTNNKPIVLLYENHLYFPAFVQYHPSDLKLQSTASIINYRILPQNKMQWALWPLIRWNPLESNINVDTYPSPPSNDNWLGTDDRGRDVLARLIYGFRFSIGFAILAWFFSYLIGTILGALMGFLGGLTDLIGQRCVEIMETVPFLLLLITLVDLLGGASFWLLVAFLAFFRWVNISYYIRAEFLALRKREFVDVCRVQGMPTLRIIFKHILPNALNPILTFSPFSISGLISVLAILDYLGFGLPPPTPSWGELLLQAEKYFTIAWWLAVFPSIALVFTLLNLIFIGNGIQNAFDPRKTT